MWEARAEYADGTEYYCCYPSESTGTKSEQEEQHALEEMLIRRHPDCTWYSVNWVEENIWNTLSY